MKILIRSTLLALAVAITGLFTQATVEMPAVTSTQNSLVKVVKKMAKKHRKHKKKRAE
jgi:hypothetical protein